MNVYDIVGRLPSIEVLRDRCRALAVLEIIQGSDYAYYTYGGWGDDEAALMSNGSGDEFSIVFTDVGVFIRVFDHESEMTPYANDDHALWPGLLDGLPRRFRPYVSEPAFCDEGRLNATAVLWRLLSDGRWHAGTGITFPPSRGSYDTSPDGADRLAILCDDIVDRCVDFARDYYEVEVDRVGWRTSWPCARSPTTWCGRSTPTPASPTSTTPLPGSDTRSVDRSDENRGTHAMPPTACYGL